MQISLQRRHLIAGTVGLALSRVSLAQSTEPSTAKIEPPTEEVPYVQTPTHVVRRMLQLADVGRRDTLWDLGSGDGRIVIAAAKLGARAVGYEIDPTLVRESMQRARHERVSARAKFVMQDIFTLNFREPSVVTMYLLPEFNLKLRPLLLAQMKPGARIVSHEWDMGDWLPDETLLYPSEEKAHGTIKQHKVFLWVVPETVAGTWRTTIERGTARSAAQSFELSISQSFQKLDVHTSRGRILWTQLRGTQLVVAIEDGSERFVLRGTVHSAQTSAAQTRQWVGDVDELRTNQRGAAITRPRFRALQLPR